MTIYAYPVRPGAGFRIQRLHRKILYNMPRGHKKKYIYTSHVIISKKAGKVDVFITRRLRVGNTFFFWFVSLHFEVLILSCSVPPMSSCVTGSLLAKEGSAPLRDIVCDLDHKSQHKSQIYSQQKFYLFYPPPILGIKRNLVQYYFCIE
jgi:hypothetical protein